MKKITKYNEYNRRDDSIINKVIKEDKNETSNTDEVNRLVLDNLKNIQTKMTNLSTSRKSHSQNSNQ